MMRTNLPVFGAKEKVCRSSDVPLLTRPTKDELKQAERTYDTVLNTPTKTRAFVDVVDDAMDLHESEERAAAKAAKAATR